MAKEDLLIRVLNTKTQKVKFVFPSIANNKQLMRNMDFVISDPQYDAKMEAFKNKKPFSENGVSKEPVKESFAPVIAQPIKHEPVKNEINIPIIGEREVTLNSKPIVNEPLKAKRIRRTKEQIAIDNQKQLTK